MTFGAFEFLILLFIVLILIGPRRIGNLGKALGRSVRDFRLEFGRRDHELGPGEDPEDPPSKRR